MRYIRVAASCFNYTVFTFEWKLPADLVFGLVIVVILIGISVYLKGSTGQTESISLIAHNMTYIRDTKKDF